MAAALDQDLAVLQEVRDLAERAHVAAKALRGFDQARTDRIFEALFKVSLENAERLGRLAHEETGFGNPVDKATKNRFASQFVYDAYKNMATVGVLHRDEAAKTLLIAYPVGPVAAIIPSTNPTSTTIFKALIALKARNPIVFSPHPSAKKCIAETARLLAQAAEAAGAPSGSIGCLQTPSLAATQELMKHRRTRVILATGGMGLVRSAYSSGKPAYGVGAGNVPSFIERTADLPKAVGDVIAGTTFDYGTLCSSEQSVIVDAPVAEEVARLFREQGGYFLSEAEQVALAAIVVTKERTLNPAVVGRPAETIARMAGLSVPAGTRVLIAPLAGVGRDYPLSIEKLSPILSWYVEDGWERGCERCIQVLEYGGMGHTMSIHSRDDSVVLKFGLEKPVFRIVVNSPSALGAVGYTTNVPPSMSLGCGALGNNITSENIGPKHLMNTKLVAYGVRPFRSFIQQQGAAEQGAVPAPTQPSGDPQRLTRIIDEVLGARGAAAPVPVAAPAASPVRSAAPDAPRRAESANPPPVPTEFVCEDDVRRAIRGGKKIAIGPKTIVTPAARDLADANGVFA